MRLTQREEQVRQLQDQLRLRTQEIDNVALDLQLRIDLLQQECNLHRAAHIYFNRLHEDQARMYQQLLYGQAYVR
jgi:hypothetical protein